MIGPAAPLCMDAEMVKLWWEADRRAWKIGGKPVNHNVSPCDDCCRAFAESMRPDHCNGLYPGENPEPMSSALRHHGYGSEEERIAARRATWRRANQLRRALQAAR